MKTAIQHLKISSAGFHKFAFFILTFYFLKLINQFESIMQNKPNLPDALMNVTSFYTVDYENKSNWNLVKTKPIQTQYKANSNPIPEKPKMNVTSILTKDYENERLQAPKKQTQFKPNQTQFLKIPDNLSIIVSTPLLTGVDKLCQIMDNEIKVVHNPEPGREIDAFACKTK